MAVFTYFHVSMRSALCSKARTKLQGNAILQVFTFRDSPLPQVLFAAQESPELTAAC